MLDVRKRIPTNDTDDKPVQPGGTLLERLAGVKGQRICLPHGSAQSRFEPRSYPASDSGAAPSWLTDEAWRKRGRRVN
jgi:hypothetical protein